MKIYSFLLTLFFTLISFNVSCDELKIRTNKDILIGGEAFYLTISYDGSSDSNPNLDSLKNDFQIVSNSFSRSVNIVNGNISQSKNWRLGLIPLREGKIKIKPVKLDNLISNDLDIEVKELTDTAYIKDSRYNSNAPFFQIKQTADTVSPYIQQQVTFLVTIYDSIGLKIKNITTNYEASNDWVITPILDTPIVEKDVIDGKQVNVIHYAFAGFPQKSGKIKEPRFIVDGYYLKNNDFSLPTFDDDFFNFGFNNVFNQQVPVKMQTKEKFSDVKPVPLNYKGKYWLPLYGLNIDSEFNNIDDIKQGDAFNQKISITAIGLHEKMFPQIQFPSTNGIKNYPENPKFSSKISKGYIETTANINNVYIPNAVGEMTIPAVEIDWFNLNTQKMEKSSIPPKMIKVKNNPNIVSAYTNTSNTKTVEINDPIINEISSKIKNQIDYYKYLHWLWLFVGFLFFLYCYKVQANKHVHRNRVIKAIKKHDYRKARELLIEWAKVKFSDASIKNTNDISMYVKNDDFNSQLSILNKLIYSNTGEFFSSTKFIEIFKNIDKIKYSKGIKENPIPQLYD